VKLLVICSGNICRSPMVAEYLRHRAAHAGLSHLVVGSAGTLGIHGRAAADEAIETLSEAGLDLSSHRSKGIDDADVRSSDWVIAMARDHVEYMLHEYPDASARVLLLRAFEHGTTPVQLAADLDDPIGHSIAHYREQFQTIRLCVDHLVMHLRHASPTASDG